MEERYNIHINLSDAARACIGTLEGAGFEAFAVGGCVRDSILGQTPADFDIATNALPSVTEEIFARAGKKTFNVGKKHGTISVLFEEGGVSETVEVTTYRADGAYLDARHPENVKFLRTIEEDLARRDFTMNAIAYNPRVGIVAPYDGLRDIENKIIRCVGDPQKRFSEDALRILRACRFKSQLGFDIEDATWKAAVSKKSNLLLIADERITTEIDKLLQGDHVLDALLDCVDALETAIPELTTCRGFDQHTKYHKFDVYEHIAQVVAHAKNTQLLRWAALCHDLGKPSTFFIDEKGAGHFYGHERQGKRVAKAMLKRFSIPEKTKERILVLIERHNDTLSPTKKSIISTIRLMNGDVWLYRQLLELKRADSLGHANAYVKQVDTFNEIEKMLDDMLDQGIVFDVKNLDVNGNDLMALGIEEGPRIKEKLQIALEWVQGGVCKNNHDELVAQFKKNFIK